MCFIFEREKPLLISVKCLWRENLRKYDDKSIDSCVVAEGMPWISCLARELHATVNERSKIYMKLEMNHKNIEVQNFKKNVKGVEYA